MQGADEKCVCVCQKATISIGVGEEFQSLKLIILKQSSWLFLEEPCGLSLYIPDNQLVISEGAK